jgi:endonuclease III
VSQKEPLPPRGERVAERRARAERVVAGLRSSYPQSRTALEHRNPFELLIATILSAQCTDERVNQVTPALFEACPTPAALAAAPVAELERLVQPTGFFRQKAKNIQATGQRLDDVFGGTVPHTIEELTSLAGVARKTANVVISNCFPEHAVGIAVDTHVQRIARRLGLTRAWDPVEVERELVRLLPSSTWNDITHLMIDHGRAVCRAPRPVCPECPIAELCPSRDRFVAAGAIAPVRRAGARRPGP